MALTKSTSRQTYFSLSVSNSLADINGFQGSPMRTPNIRLKNRLDEAWMRAEKKYNEDTKRFLGSYDLKSKDSVLRQLKQRYDSECKDGKARTETLARILNAIDLVGAFAAQGVSIIFGPANLCFNAISFLINAPHQILKVYDELQTLFEEIERFLVKFKIYRRIEDTVGIANELCEATNFLLMSFVKVCGIATGLLQSRKRDVFKNGIMVVLFQDDRLGTAIEEFKDLCNSSSSLANTVMLEHVLSSEVDVKQILSAARRLEIGVGLLVARSNDEKTRLVNKDHLERIRRTLFLRPPSEEVLTPSNQENGIDTLSALQATVDYDRWMNGAGMIASTLVLWGPPGSGKSYMLQTVRDNLNIRRECAGRVESSIYVAVHNFKEVNSRSPKDQKAISPIADILKRIAFQVAIQSTTYAKELATLISTVPQLRSERDLVKVWNFLKLSENRALSGATMYILLDGVERRDLKGDLRKLLDLFMETRPNTSHKGLKIRILLTMNERPETVRTNHYFSVAINDINRKLVAAFAVEEMRQRDVLQDIDKDTITLRQEFSRKLIVGRPDITFVGIRQRIMALKEAIDDDQPYSGIAHILDDPSNKKWSDSGADVIKELQSQLNERSVALLNNILLFLLSAPDGCMSVELLEAGLRLGEFELPIEPLVKKIRSQYSKVVGIHNETVFIRSAMVPALRNTKSNDTGSNAKTPGEALVSIRIEISNATERTVKKFLWDLNQQMLTGSFDFSAASATPACTYRVHVNTLQAQLSMVRLCFKVINEGWDDKTKPMLTYACLHLPAHLAILQDSASKVNDIDRKMIGEGLITYLTDPYNVKLKHESYGLGQWMYEDRTVDAMRFWLELSAQQLSLKEQRWVRQSMERSRGRLGFLQDLAIALGEYWLTDPKSSCYALFSWLNTYIEKVSLALSRLGNLLTYQNTSFPTLPTRNGRESPRSNPPKESNFLADLFNTTSECTRRVVTSRTQNDLTNRAVRFESLKEIKEDQSEEDLPILSKIHRATAWVVSHTRLVPCSSMYLALGNTCLSVEEWALGIECYKKIHPKYTEKHFALLGSAFCKLALRDIGPGLETGREAFTTFRSLADQDQLSADDLQYYLTSLKQMGEHFECLHQLPQALSFYEEAFLRMPEDDVLSWKVLKLRCETDDIQGSAYITLLEWSENYEHFGAASPAVSIINLVSEHEYETLLLPLSRAMRNLYLQNLFIQIIEDAFELASGSGETLALARLKYLQGIAFNLSSETGSSLSAIQTWKEVLQLASDEIAEPWGISQLRTAAADNALRSEFDNLRSRLLSDVSLSREEKYQLYEGFNEHFGSIMGDFPALSNYRGVDSGENFVVSLCSMVDIVEARRIYRKDMAQALEILTDNDENNDAAGVYILCRIFCAMGDVVGALSAFSLYDRAITRRRFEDPRSCPEPEWTIRDKIATGSVRSCTICSTTLYSSDAEGMWWCCFCPAFELCDTCKKSFENGTVRHEKCSRLHVSSYVHLVHSDYTQTELVDSKVRVDWEYVKNDSNDFMRTGGRVIELEDWIEEIRVLWDLPEPEGEGSRAQQ